MALEEPGHTHTHPGPDNQRREQNVAKILDCDLGETPEVGLQGSLRVVDPEPTRARFDDTRTDHSDCPWG